MRTFKLILAMLLCFTAPALAQETPGILLAEPKLPASPYVYAIELPPHLHGLHKLETTSPNSDVTETGAALGRVLFHDRQLSENGLVACASCHTQAIGFDDPTRLSIGFQGKVTRRGAMTLVNARFNPNGRYFRDERAASLEEQVLDPFHDPIEMGLKPGELVERINAKNWYGPLFLAAFGDELVSEARIASALAQYVRSIVSYRSRYDQARAEAISADLPFAKFSAAENRGKYLFFRSRDQGGAGCSACHQSEAFVMFEPQNNGLENLADSLDLGLGEITGQHTDQGKFRAASLRNIAVTAPYMHDGRFFSLEEVVAHYSQGIKDHPNLSASLRNKDGSPIRLDFSKEDIDALVAFLKTLTDDELNSDPKFSDPFLTTK